MRTDSNFSIPSIPNIPKSLLMTLLLVARYDIYDLSCLARMRPEDVAADLAELKRKGYLQGR